MLKVASGHGNLSGIIHESQEIAVIKPLGNYLIGLIFDSCR